MFAVFLFAFAAQAQDSASLTLGAVVDRALASHPAIAAARAMRDRTTADLGGARAALLPTIGIDGSLNRFQEPMVVRPLHGLDLRNPPLFDRSLVQSEVTLNWTVWDFGRRSAQVRAQRALGDAADEAIGSTAQQLAARTVNAFLRVLTARDVLAAQDERIAALAAAAGRIAQLQTEGKAARVDALRMDAEVKRARADRIGASARLDVAEHELAQLGDMAYAAVHAARLTPLRLADSAFAADSSPALRADLVARSRSANGQVRELEQRVRAAEAGVGAARAAWFPEVRAAGAYVDRGRWSGDHAAEWQTGIAVVYPLYNGGGRESAIQRASADDRVGTEQLRSARQEAERGVDQTLAALRESHARVGALESAVAQSEEVAHIERLALDVGTAIQSDYLMAEASLLSARAALIDARHTEISSRVELARILGELSPDWLARTVESAK